MDPKQPSQNSASSSKKQFQYSTEQFSNQNSTRQHLTDPLASIRSRKRRHSFAINTGEAVGRVDQVEQIKTSMKRRRKDKNLSSTDWEANRIYKANKGEDYIQEKRKDESYSSREDVKSMDYKQEKIKDRVLGSRVEIRSKDYNKEKRCDKIPVIHCSQKELNYQYSNEDQFFNILESNICLKVSLKF